MMKTFALLLVAGALSASSSVEFPDALAAQNAQKPVSDLSSHASRRA